ncbi:Uncharacterised protein [Vibrio cholerae]|nr:Uncharacterised protein [Vibrio cholerae]
MFFLFHPRFFYHAVLFTLCINKENPHFYIRMIFFCVAFHLREQLAVGKHILLRQSWST